MVFFSDKTPDVTQLALDLLWKDVHPVSESKEDKPIVKPRYEPLFSLSEIVHPIQQYLETKQSTLFLPETIDYVRSELRRIKKREYEIERRKMNQDRHNAYNRQWYAKNRDKCNARMCEWRETNRDKGNAYHRKQCEWRKNNRDKVNAYQRKQYAKNRDKCNARIREWRKNNRDKVKAYQRKRYAEIRDRLYK